MKKHSIISALLSIFLTTFAVSSFAKNISLYEQPNLNSKIVESLDSSMDIITIFTPKESEWIKVADPRNGNVGWIKSSDLGNSKMSINIITTGDGAKGYQIIQFGNIQHLNTEQMQNAVKKIELQQQNIQKDMQKMMQEILNNSQWRFPLIMPVMATPDQSAAPAASVVNKPGM